MKAAGQSHALGKPNYRPSSFSTYVLRVSSQLAGVYPVSVILVRSRAELVGRGLTGLVALAKYWSVLMGLTLLPCCPSSGPEHLPGDVRPGLHGAGTGQVVGTVGGVRVEQVEDRPGPCHW